MPEAARRLTVSGEIVGDYIVDEELPDGCLVIRPDTTAAATNRRLGLEPLSAAAFETFIAETRGQMLAPGDEG